MLPIFMLNVFPKMQKMTTLLEPDGRVIDNLVLSTGLPDDNVNWPPRKRDSEADVSSVGLKHDQTAPDKVAKR